VSAYHSEPRGPHLAARTMFCIPGRGCSGSLSFGAAGAALGRSKYVVMYRAGVAQLAYHSGSRGALLAARNMSCILGRDGSVSLSFGAAGGAHGRSKYVVKFRAGIAVVAYHSGPRGPHLANRNVVYSGQGWQ
jgi:hypothetical protein